MSKIIINTKTKTELSKPLSTWRANQAKSHTTPSKNLNCATSQKSWKEIGRLLWISVIACSSYEISFGRSILRRCARCLIARKFKWASGQWALTVLTNLYFSNKLSRRSRGTSSPLKSHTGQRFSGDRITILQARLLRVEKGNTHMVRIACTLKNQTAGISISYPLLVIKFLRSPRRRGVGT